jgi:hypothetical protein
LNINKTLLRISIIILSTSIGSTVFASPVGYENHQKVNTSQFIFQNNFSDKDHNNWLAYQGLKQLAKDHIDWNVYPWNQLYGDKLGIRCC